MSASAKFIVWDWNGTLFDDAHAVLATTNQLLENLGRAPVSVADFHAHYAIPLESFYRNLGITDAEMPAMVSKGSAFHDYYEPRAAKVGLREGAKDLLAMTHGHNIQTLILSNHIVDAIRVQLSRFEIEHLFHEVLAYANRDVQFLDMTKGERLRRYMATHGHNPQNGIIIGDSPEEIEIARELGLVGVAITGGCVSEQRLAATKPDHLIHSLPELKPVLQDRGFVA